MADQNKLPLELKSQTFIPTVNVAAATWPARPPLPPFTRETAPQKIRLAEDGWNSRDPEKVALAYTPDSRWRTARNSSLEERQSSLFLSTNGQGNWSID